MSFRDKLSQMSEQWDKAKIPNVNGVPFGEYDCRLQSASLSESESSGKISAHFEHLIVDPDSEFSGEVLHEYQLLESSFGPTAIRQRFEQMEFDPPDDITELEDALADLAAAAPAYRLKITQSGEFARFRVLRRLDLEEEAPAPAKKAASKKAETPAPAKASKKAEKKAADDIPYTDEEVLLQKTKAFAKANDIPVTAKSTVATLTKEIAKYEWDVEGEDLALLQQLGIMEGAAQEEEIQEEEESGPDLEALGAFCKEYGIDTSGLPETVEAFAELLAEYDFSEATAEEKALLGTIGHNDGTADNSVEEEAEGETAEESEYPTRDDLDEFVAAQNLEEITDSMSDAQVIAAIKEYEFERAELSPDEIKLIKAIGGYFKGK